MSDNTKLAACLVMSAVGLVITVDHWRILRLPKQPGVGVGKHLRPVQSQGASPAS